MSGLSPCGEIVRAGDPVRFRNALFAPPELREQLFALYAFNLELAKIAPMVSEPMIGEIRLQWWRETLDMAYGDGAARKHEVAEPLTAAIREAGLPRAALEAMIDARGRDLDPAFPESDSALWSYLDATGGALAELAAQALSGTQAGRVAARATGGAIAASRWLISLPEQMAQGRAPLPDAEIDWTALRAGMPDAAFAKAVAGLARQGRAVLEIAEQGRPGVPRKAAPALLERCDAAATLIEASRNDGTLAGLAGAAPSPFRSNFARLWRGSSGRW